MPISPSEINRAWLVIHPEATLGEVRARVPRDDRRIQWLVTPLPDQTYAVYRVTDLIAYLTRTLEIEFVTSRLLNQPLSEINGMLAAFARPAVDVNADLTKVNWNARSDPPLVVLQNGTIIGILKKTFRSGDGDPDWIDNEPKSANGGGAHPPAPPAAPPPPPPDSLQPEEPEAGPGVLKGEEPVAAPPARYINVLFDPPEQKDSPLQVDVTYTLVFSVELERLAQAIANPVLDEARLFPPNVDKIDMFVQLISDDFEIFTDPQKLIVPREGKSKNRARFDISPKKKGVGEITAVFLKDGNAVQAIKLKLAVGVEGSHALVGSDVLGRPVDMAGAVKPRALSLWIDYVGSGFKISFLGPDAAESFMIPLQLQELEQEIAKARKALLEIVNFKKGNQFTYQANTDIPAAVSEQTLPVLARAGFLLFQKIFNHPGSGQPAKDFAKRLRDMARGETLNIQIISKQMMLPWGILYLADRFDETNINPELFLGLKHIIEHAPMEPSMDFPTNITTQPKLTVSLNLNKDIDRQMNFPLIANQQKYWDGIEAKGGVTLITRTSGKSLVQALADDATPDQIAYFYCHAISKNLAEGGADASFLEFGEKQAVTLEDLMLSAPSDIRLGGAPLVFINACESAELSPLFYNGFMPYFVDKGARGMIGTECPVPALFASEWAEKFFDQFLGGKPLGHAFLDLRREYFFDHHNILGLLYAVYCDADTQVTPALG